MKVVIKVGSQSILSPEGKPIMDIIISVIDQIILLQKNGHKVVLVSSGAVALGRGIAKKILGKTYASSIAEKQLLASLGQPQLMTIYTKLCEERGYLAAQLLLTKYDFQTKRSYGNILRLLQKSLDQENIITIINENDSVAVDELMFTDNDELSGIIAAQIGADKLLLLTTTDGVYDKNPSELNAKLIPILKLNDVLPDTSGKSSLGRGGMSSKINTARKMARAGIMTHIATLNHPNIISELILSSTEIGTRIIPEQKQTSRKKFLAFNQGHSEYTITVNWGLVKVLAKHSATSILPIGIEKTHGEFKRGDVIEILNPDGVKIGVGVAKYNASKLLEFIGGHNHPEFIHYDYLHVDYDRCI